MSLVCACVRVCVAGHGFFMQPKHLAYTFERIGRMLHGDKCAIALLPLPLALPCPAPGPAPQLQLQLWKDLAAPSLPDIDRPDNSVLAPKPLY